MVPHLGPHLVPIEGLEAKHQLTNVITIGRMITAATAIEGQGRNRGITLGVQRGPKREGLGAKAPCQTGDWLIIPLDYSRASNKHDGYQREHRELVDMGFIINPIKTVVRPDAHGRGGDMSSRC